MSNFAFQVTKAFQGNGEFAFQGSTGVTVTPKQAGHGKAARRNEIIEIEGKRWVVPKDRVEEFLSLFEKKPAPVVEIQTLRTDEILLRPVSFTTSSGKVVKTTEEAIKDDMGLILILAALADEDFYED